MKKKPLPLILICILALTAAFALSGRRPFRNLQPSDIVSASVCLSPPDVTAGIPDIPELVSYLRTIVIYRRDDTYHDYSGQGVTFTLELSDGTQTSVTPYNPFFIIDGKGYRTKYKPCEALNRYANQLLSPWGR